MHVTPKVLESTCGESHGAEKDRKEFPRVQPRARCCRFRDIELFVFLIQVVFQQTKIEISPPPLNSETFVSCFILL